MSQFLHKDNINNNKAKAIPQVFSDNGQAKNKGGIRMDPIKMAWPFTK